MSKTEIGKETGGEIHIPARPVTFADAYAKDDAFMRKVSDGALEAHPNFENIRELVAEMNDNDGTSLGPHDDASASVGTGLRSTLDKNVRERAYFLWQSAGRPEDCADDFWFQAKIEDCSERAYALWEGEGRPQGKADEHWYRVSISKTL